MTTPPHHKCAFRHLSEVSSGSAPLERLLKVFSLFPEMCALPPSEKFKGYLRDWATQQGHHPDEAFDPLVEGSIERGQFLPFTFTRQEFARQVAINRGQIKQYEALLLSNQYWNTALYTFLTEGYGGLYIDPGTDHSVKLTREDLTRLVSLTTLPTFARFPVLHVVTAQNRILLHPMEGQACVLAFDCNAQAIQNAIFSGDNHLPDGDFSVASFRSAEVYQTLLQSTARQLVVNPGLNDSRIYNRAEVKRILQLHLEGDKSPVLQNDKASDSWL